MSKMEEYQGREKQEMRESYDAARNQEEQVERGLDIDVERIAFAPYWEMACKERPRLRRRGRK